MIRRTHLTLVIHLVPGAWHGGIIFKNGHWVIVYCLKYTFRNTTSGFWGRIFYAIEFCSEKISLSQKRMASEGLVFVKEFSIGNVRFDQFSTHLFDQVDHSWIEISNPIHFVVVISLVGMMKDSARRQDHCPIRPGSLVLRDDPE